MALPAAVPLSVNATDLPETGLPPEVRVAESATVPPNVPVAGLTARAVAAALTVCTTLPLLAAKLPLAP